MKLHSLFKLRKFELTPPIYAIIVSFLAAFCAHVSWATTYYVSPTGYDGSDGTKADPLGALATALEKDDVTRVVLTDGWHVFNGTKTISSGIVIESENGPEVTHLYAWSTSNKAIILDHADAVLSGIDFSGVSEDGSTRPGCRGAVQITANGGTITNCRFHDYNINIKGAIATIKMDAGIIVASDICSNRCSASSVPTAGLSVLEGALADRCRIFCNGLEGTKPMYGAVVAGDAGSVIASGGGGIVRNSLVVNNCGTSCGVGFTHWLPAQNGHALKFINCTIVGNEATAAAAATMDGASAIDCLQYHNTGKGILYDLVDPGFIDATGDFHLRFSSTSVDASTGTGDLGQLDLDGNSRVIGAKADKGCYEYDPAVFQLFLETRSLAGYFAPITVEFTASANVALDPAKCWWTFDGSEPTAGHHEKEGIVVENELPAGEYAARLAVEYDGKVYSRSVAVISPAPATYYVSPTGDDAASGLDAEHPLATVESAVGRADAAVVRLMDGWHTLSSVLTLGHSLRIESVNGPAVTHVYFKLPINLSADGAELVGLDLTGTDSAGNCPNGDGYVKMTAADAVVSNCVLRSHKLASLYGAIWMQNGKLVDSQVISNNVSAKQADGTTGVYLNGAGCFVDRCVFRGNGRGVSTIAGGGGFYVKSAGGTIRNCLIEDNKGITAGGIFSHWSYGGRCDLYNCTFANNEATGGNYTYSGSYDGTALKLYDCVFYNNVRMGVPYDTTDPGFVNAANGDFHLSASASTLIDASTATFDLGPYDLDGNARYQGRGDSPFVADKGCYEYDPNQFALSIGYTPLGTFAPMDVEYKATVVTAEQIDESKCWWTFDGSEPSAENHAATGICVTNLTAPRMMTVRFKIELGGQTYSADKTDWFALMAQTVYMVESNPNAEAPYATWETAATSFADVFKWMTSGSTLVISNGHYALPSKTLESGMVIRSVNGPEVTDVATTGNDPAFALIHADCAVAGLTVRARAVSSNRGGAIIMSAGLVTNCVVKDSTCAYNGGDGISASGGLIVDCTITNCYSQSSLTSNPDYGVGLQLSGTAVADRCRVYGCYAGQGNGGLGAVSVGSGATIRNSLICGNRLGGTSGIFVSKGGQVENCTVVSNASTRAVATEPQATAVWLASLNSAGVTNTISSQNVDDTGAAANIGGVDGWEANVGNCFIGGDPLFRNLARWDFRLRQSSPCVNAGVVLPWMADAKDLDGNPRMTREGTVDIGSYQASRNGLILLVR